MSSFLENGRKGILVHPAAESFLHLKWMVRMARRSNVFPQAVSKLLYMNMLLYFLYLLSFTSLACWTTTDKFNSNHPLGANSSQVGTQSEGESKNIRSKHMTAWWVLLVVSSVFTAITFLRALVNAATEGYR